MTIQCCFVLINEFDNFWNRVRTSLKTTIIRHIFAWTTPTQMINLKRKVLFKFDLTLLWPKVMALLDFSRAKCCLVWSFCASTALCIIEWSCWSSVQAISIQQQWECCYRPGKGTFNSVNFARSWTQKEYKVKKSTDLCIYLWARQRTFHPCQLW